MIAVGFSVSVPFYAFLISWLFTRADIGFAILYAVAALQIGALGIGCVGGSSGGLRRRLSSGSLSLASQKGDHRLLPRSVSRNVGENG